MGIADVSKVDVWATESQYDYDQYQGLKSKATLLNVPWDVGYHDVVDWQNDTERDQWFASQTSTVVDVNLPAQVKNIEVFSTYTNSHHGTIRVACPYEEAISFNYMVLELSSLPVPTPAVRPERHWFGFFLVGYNQIAANTTEYQIELDTWTTFKNSVNVPTFLMERGHWPAAQSKFADFIAAPYNYRGYLSEPEPDVPAERGLHHSEFVPFNTGDDYYVFGTYADPWGSFDTVVSTANNTGTLSASGDCAGGTNLYNISVAGYNDTAPAGIVPVNEYNHAGTPMHYFAIAASSVDGFVMAAHPMLLNSIEVIYVVNDAWCQLTPAGAIAGYPTFTIANAGVSVLGSLMPTAADMPWAQDWSKLACYPYSVLKLTVDGREEIELHLQDCVTDAEIRTQLNLIDGVLSPWVAGVLGNGDLTVNSTVYNATVSTATPEGLKVLERLDIPTYEIAVNAYELAQKKLQGRWAQDLQQANRLMRNGQDMYNVINGNAWVSGTTARNASNAVSDASQSATTTQANAAYQNAVDSANTQAWNDQMTNNTATLVLNAKQDGEADVLAAQQGLRLIETLLENQYKIDSNTTQLILARSEKELQAAERLRDSMIQLWTGILANPLGVITMGGGTVQAYANYAADLVDIGNAMAIAEAQLDNALADWKTWQDNLNNNRTMVEDNILQIQQDTQDAVRQLESNANTQNIQRTADTAKENAARTLNATNSAAATVNSGAHSAADSSYCGTTTTGHNSAILSYLAGARESEDTLKDNVSEKADAASSDLITSGLHTATAYDVGLWGVKLSVVEPSPATIQAAEMVFPFYGYRWRGVVPNPVWQVCEHFSYWQGEAYVMSDTVNEPNRAILRDIFARGTRIWSDADEIGYITSNKPA